MTPTRFNRLLLEATLLPVVMLAVVLVVLAGQSRELYDSLNSVRHTEQVIAQIRSMSKILVSDAASHEHRPRVGEEQKRVATALAGLRTLTLDNAAEQAALTRLDSLLRAVDGTHAFDQARPTLTAMMDEEMRLLGVRHALLEREVDVLSWLFLIAGGLLAIGTTVLMRRKLLELKERYAATSDSLVEQMKALEEREQALERINEGLEATIAERTAEASVREERDALAALQKKKDEMVGFMVHDLRNPLAVLRSDASFLAEQPELAPESREAALALLEAAVEMDKLSLDMLDVALSSNGALAVSPKPFDAQDLAQRAVRQARHHLLGRNHSVRAEVKLADASCLGDAVLVQRVLENFLGNAFKYTPAGCSVVVELADSATGLVLKVKDSGPGIPLEHRHRIFERFARLDRDAGHHRHSRGLGLAFCRLAADALGGRVWVEDNQPVGSAFCFEFPRRFAAVSALPLPAALPVPARIPLLRAV